jgi:sugar lactone lactonase YvrE
MRSTRFATALALAATLAAATPALGSVADPEVVVSFDATAQEFPEGVALDGAGNIYTTHGLPFFVGPGDGWVKMTTPEGTTSTLAHFPGGQGPAGIVVDQAGDIYFARPNPMDEASRGVWHLDGGGMPERLSGTEAILMANGLALDGDGHLFVSDSATGSIWRLTLDGSVEPEAWLADPALTGCAEGDVGVNGIALTDGGMYAAVTSRGVLVHIPILDDGSAGAAEVLAGDARSCEPDELFGLDGIALDADGGVYALLVLQHQLVRIDPDGASVEVLLTAEDGLHNASSLAFGVADGDTENLYLANFAVLPPAPEASLGAGVLRVGLGQ